MIRGYELNAKDIRHQTMQALLKHIPLRANGYRCTTEMVLDVVLKASADRSSVEAACADLEQVADSNTIRDYLNQAFRIRDLLEQEAQMNAVLAESIPASMQRAGLEVAIDFHDEAFYGKRPELRAVACRGQAKQGTSHFIRLASAYVIWRDVRLTLTVRYVLPGQAKLDILRGLLDDLQQLGFTFNVLYLDKAFASTEIIRYLAQPGQPTIIACSIRGKQGGTRALCQGRKSYRTGYTFSDGAQAELALVASLVPDKTGRRRRKWLAFIVIHLDWSPHRIYRRYRRRFGIECSYRSLRRARASTTSRNPALRFFLMALGLALVNTWIWFRWEFARVKGPGPRRIYSAGLRFHRFTRLLVRSIEAIYGVVMTIPTHFSPQSVIY
jgi:putative transposase